MYFSDIVELYNDVCYTLCNCAIRLMRKLSFMATTAKAALWLWTSFKSAKRSISRKYNRLRSESTVAPVSKFSVWKTGLIKQNIFKQSLFSMIRISQIDVVYLYLFWK